MRPHVPYQRPWRAGAWAMLIPTVAQCATIAHAYPIPPVPLRQLVDDADVIAVVKVQAVVGSVCGRWGCAVRTEAVETPASQPAPSSGAAPTDGQGADSAGKRAATLEDYVALLPVAVLEVTKVLKGPARIGKLLWVRFEGYLICPAPPRYVPGETVLVFLKQSKRFGGWQTCSLSYGTIVLDDQAARDDYVARVCEWLDIAAIQDTDQRRMQTLEWLLRCIESPHTRWEGAYDLYRDSDRWERAHGGVARTENLLAHMSPEQKRRLLGACKSVQPEDAAHFSLRRLKERVEENVEPSPRADRRR